MEQFFSKLHLDISIYFWVLHVNALENLDMEKLALKVKVQSIRFSEDDLAP